MRVLVVEDHETLANRIAQGLRHAGMAVDLERDGSGALRALAHTAYDVIVLDRDLPVVHGDSVCQAVAGSGPRILMLTAAAGVEDRIDGLERGQMTTSASRLSSVSSSPACGRCRAGTRPRRRSCSAATSRSTVRAIARAEARGRCR